MLRVQPDTAARPNAARSTRALLRRGAGDLREGEGWNAGPGVVAGFAGEPAVDHRDDVFDGDRGFGDVRAEDELGSGAGRHGAILFFGREVSVQLHELEA